MRHTTSFICLFLVASLSIGCGSSNAGPAKTPRAAVKNSLQALLDGDSDQFVACFDATDAQKEAILGMANMHAAMKKFQAKFVEAYGEEAWEKFENKDDSTGGGSPGSQLISEEDIAKIDKVEIKVDGDKRHSLRRVKSKNRSWSRREMSGSSMRLPCFLREPIQSLSER